jgi:hypothetical protein
MLLYQGDDKRYPFRVRYRNLDGTVGAAVDLTGCIAKAQIRPTYASTEVLAEFTATVAVDQVNQRGIVLLSLTAAQTAALAVPSSAQPDDAGYYLIGVWDVQITYPDGRVQTYLVADARLHPQVTRP